jgi:hypothetical protein
MNNKLGRIYDGLIVANFMAQSLNPLKRDCVKLQKIQPAQHSTCVSATYERGILIPCNVSYAHEKTKGISI